MKVSKILCLAILSASLNATETELKPITVTAQKSEENVQDIPLSLSVFDEINFEDKELENLQDLSSFVPNFYMLNPGDFGAYQPSIRGISSSFSLLSSSTSIYVNGIPSTNAMAFNTTLEDIQRIEVLRGPQSTLYGKGAEAGVINVITKKPDNHFGGRLSLSYGEENKQEGSLSVKTPIIKDKLFAGITGRYYSKDGFLKNSSTNDYDNDRKNYYSKIHLRATPTDRLEMSLIASRFKRDDGAVSQNSLTANDYRVYSSDINGYNKSSDDSLVFQAKYEFDNFNVQSTSSYTKNKHLRYSDLDYTSSKNFHIYINMPTKTISQELKFDGEYENLKWLFGLLGSSIKRSGGYQITSSNVAYNTSFISSTEKQKSFSAFTQAKYAFTDRFAMTSGISYNIDKNEMHSQTYSYDDSQTSKNVSPKIALEYKLTPQVLTYISASKGYKSGGYYLVAPTGYDKSFKSETLWNYETGVKSTLFGGKVQLNGAIYYMDIKDMQVVSYINDYQTYMSNAASATSKGVEIESIYLINDNFSVFANFGINETKFKHFKDLTQDYEGNYNPFAPKYNYALGGTYRGFDGVYASANVTGYGKMYLNNSNTYSQGAYTLVNAKIGYEWDDYDIYLYGNNIFDKEYDLAGSFNQYAFLSKPREIGIRFTYRF